MQGFTGIARFANDFEMRDRFETSSQSIPHQGVIVNEKDVYY